MRKCMNTNYNLLKNKEIIAILDGDFQIEEVDGIRIAMPYLSGPMLCELSQKFGCYVDLIINVTLVRRFYLMEPLSRIELLTYGLRIRRSTN